MQKENIEMSNNPKHQQLHKVKQMADKVILNQGTLKEFNKEINEFVITNSKKH